MRVDTKQILWISFSFFTKTFVCARTKTWYVFMCAFVLARSWVGPVSEGFFSMYVCGFGWGFRCV
jgi:hypothetical protein